MQHGTAISPCSVVLPLVSVCWTVCLTTQSVSLFVLNSRMYIHIVYFVYVRDGFAGLGEVGLVIRIRPLTQYVCRK